MYRLCVGNVSVMYRLCIGTDTMQKSYKNCIFSAKNLVMSVNFSTFAGESDLRYQNYRRLGVCATKIIYLERRMKRIIRHGDTEYLLALRAEI